MSREIYGVAIGIITLVCILLPIELFLIAVSYLSFLIAKEISSKLGEEDLAFISFFSPPIFYLESSAGLVFVFLASFVYAYTKRSLESLFRSVFLLFYTGFFLSYLIRIKEEGTYLLLIFVLSVWANDVFAYYVGKRFGRTPLFPDISPNKTLEGFIGGLTAGAFVYTLLSPKPFVPSILTAVIFLTLCVIGDYFESFIKRQLKIKDFSTVLGEHGGFTDRFDALLFSAPVYYLLT